MGGALLTLGALQVAAHAAGPATPDVSPTAQHHPRPPVEGAATISGDGQQRPTASSTDAVTVPADQDSANDAAGQVAAPSTGHSPGAQLGAALVTVTRLAAPQLTTAVTDRATLATHPHTDPSPVHPVAGLVGETVAGTTEAARRSADAVTHQVVPHVVQHLAQVAAPVTRTATQTVGSTGSAVVSTVVQPTIDTAATVTRDVVGGTGSTLHAVTATVTHTVAATVTTTKTVTSTVTSTVTGTVAGALGTVGQVTDQGDSPSISGDRSAQTAAAPAAIPIPAPTSTPQTSTPRTSARNHQRATQHRPGTIAVPVIPAALELPDAVTQSDSSHAAAQRSGGRLRVPTIRGPGVLQTPDGPQIDPFTSLLVTAAGGRDRVDPSHAVRRSSARLGLAPAYAGRVTPHREVRSPVAVPPGPGHSPD